MKKINPVVCTSFFILALSSFSTIADEYYQTPEDVIAHFYQPGGNKNAPWHKNRRDDAEGTDYSICFNKQVSQSLSQYLIVMCPDMTKNTYANEQASTDFYALKKTPQGFTLLAKDEDVAGEFQDVMDIGSDKWAIHTFTHAMNQGYEQSHDTLRVFIKSKFIAVANWTSAQNNEGAMDPDDTDAKGKIESLENKMNVDDSMKSADFYPLVIHSTGYCGDEKIDTKYNVTYSMDKGGYIIPDEVNGSY